MPTPRHGQAAAAVAEHLYVLGGCREQLFDLDVVERFEPALRWMPGHPRFPIVDYGHGWTTM